MESSVMLGSILFLYNRSSAVFIWRLMGSSASSKRISHSGTIPHAPSAVCVVRMGLLGVTRRWRECMRLVVCLYNRSSAVVRVPPVSRGRRANPVLTYETALRRFFLRWRCTAPLSHADVGRFLRWGWQSEGDGNRRRAVV